MAACGIFSHNIQTLGASLVKNPPANARDAGSILGWKDPLEKKMATHPSILVWEIHVQRSLAGWQATFRGFPKEPDTTEHLNKNNNANS